MQNGAGEQQNGAQYVLMERTQVSAPDSCEGKERSDKPFRRGTWQPGSDAGFQHGFSTQDTETFHFQK